MSDLTVESAIALASERVGQIGREAGYALELLREHTIEIARGWIFFYNSSDYVRTQDPSYELGGNGPIFVTRQGDLHELPSAKPWEEAVRDI